MTERTHHYHVVEVSADLPDSNTTFDNQVKAMLDDGWLCYGEPFIDNRNYWVQKLYKELTGETEQ